MEIGRRLLWVTETGEIIQDSGERAGAVIYTTIETDFPQYDPSIHSIMRLEYGERSFEFLNLSSYHVDISTRKLIIHPHFTFTQDKTQITGDGIDTLTITVTTSNDAADTINFTVNGVTQSVPTDANGQAVFQLVSSVPGDYTISVTSTKYGNSSANLEVV